MNREIIFRAKEKDKNEWIYGYYVKLYNDKNKDILHRIYTGLSEKECDEYFEEYFEVMQETACQFINRLDRKHVRIFEGDICNLNINEDFSISEVGVVEYLSGRYILRTNKTSYTDFMFIRSKDIEVVGNRFDNPELLNETEEKRITKYTVTIKRIYEMTETVEASNSEEADNKANEIFDELTILGQEMYNYETSIESDDQLSLFENEKEEKDI